MEILSITSQTWVITLVGYLIVFLALVSLIIVFTNVPKLLNLNFKKPEALGKGSAERSVIDTDYISGDETAAIAMALHLYFEDQHDEESNIITIKRIQRRYSPWSSKIYGVRNFPKN